MPPTPPAAPKPPPAYRVGTGPCAGTAPSTPADRTDDLCAPTWAACPLPLPLLGQHNSKEPIGWVRAARINETQIEVDCEVANITEPGTLKDRIDTAWQTIKAKLVGGLSIGFNGIETAQIENSWGIKYLRWIWLELSTVTIAAQTDAFITSIASSKAIDKEQRRARGRVEIGGANG